MRLSGPVGTWMRLRIGWFGSGALLKFIPDLSQWHGRERNCKKPVGACKWERMGASKPVGASKRKREHLNGNEFGAKLLRSSRRAVCTGTKSLSLTQKIKQESVVAV